MTADHRYHAEPVETGFSLLQSSAIQRLGMVTVLMAMLWGAVVWAMS